MRRIAILEPDAGYKQTRQRTRKPAQPREGMQSNFRVATLSSRLDRMEDGKAFLTPFFWAVLPKPGNSVQFTDCGFIYEWRVKFPG